MVLHHCFLNALLSVLLTLGVPILIERGSGAQDVERPDGKQARLQLEDMLTRIELHFQVHSIGVLTLNSSA